MSNSKKLFEKANKEFQNGEIDKAMTYCEKSIAENIRNSQAINLKGLIYYFKGDLNAAETAWKVNLESNGNAIAEKYLKNIDGDKKLFQKYVDAIKLIESHKINEAIEKLKQCESSSFNGINVSAALAKCYIKKGEITKTEYYLKKLIEQDRNHLDIKEIEENLNLYDEGNKKSFSKIIIALVALLIIGGISYFGYENKEYLLTKVEELKNKPVEKENTDEDKKEPEIKKTDSKESDTKENLKEDEATVDTGEEDKTSSELEEAENDINQEQPLKEVYDSANLTALMGQKKKDYNAIYDAFKLKEGKEVKTGDVEIINKAENLLKKNGIEYFYEMSYSARKNGNFDESVNYLSKAEEFMEGSYLRPHILYFLGISHQRLGNIEETEKYYTIYANDYPKGSYGSTAIYYLAKFYEDKDLEKAKKYASIIRNNYPKSKENNDVVSRILKK